MSFVYVVRGTLCLTCWLLSSKLHHLGHWLTLEISLAKFPYIRKFQRKNVGSNLHKMHRFWRIVFQNAFKWQFWSVWHFTIHSEYFQCRPKIPWKRTVNYHKFQKVSKKLPHHHYHQITSIGLLPKAYNTPPQAH